MTGQHRSAETSPPFRPAFRLCIIGRPRPVELVYDNPVMGSGAFVFRTEPLQRIVVVIDGFLDVCHVLVSGVIPHLSHSAVLSVSGFPVPEIARCVSNFHAVVSFML